MFLNSACSRFFRISNALSLSRGDTQRAKFKQVRRFTEKERRLCRAFLNLKTQCARQIYNLKNEQWRVFLCKFRHLEIFCRHVRSMWKLRVDPWSKTFGLVPGWNFQTCMHIVFRYICLMKTGCFRCVSLFLCFNVQISPPFCDCIVI